MLLVACSGNNRRTVLPESQAGCIVRGMIPAVSSGDWQECEIPRFAACSVCIALTGDTGRGPRTARWDQVKKPWIDARPSSAIGKCHHTPRRGRGFSGNFAITARECVGRSAGVVGGVEVLDLSSRTSSCGTCGVRSNPLGRDCLGVVARDFSRDRSLGEEPSMHAATKSTATEATPHTAFEAG
jgi:hypothetical protein